MVVKEAGELELVAGVVVEEVVPVVRLDLVAEAVKLWVLSVFMGVG